MPGHYTIRIVPSARNALLRIPDPHRHRSRIAIRGLGTEPRPAGSKPLSDGHGRSWRIRVGDYRLIYEIHDDRLLVLVIRVGHRGQVYRLR